MKEPLINPTKNTLRFKLGREQFQVGPEEEFTPPERYAYAISGMGLPLIPISEFLAPTAHQKLKQEAAAARARAEALAVEAVAMATVADRADRKGQENAKELTERARAVAEEHINAVAKADELTNAAARPETLKALNESESNADASVAIDTEKSPTKTQTPAKKSGK